MLYIVFHFRQGTEEYPARWCMSCDLLGVFTDRKVAEQYAREAGTGTFVRAVVPDHKYPVVEDVYSSRDDDAFNVCYYIE